MATRDFSTNSCGYPGVWTLLVVSKWSSGISFCTMFDVRGDYSDANYSETLAVVARVHWQLGRFTIYMAYGYVSAYETGAVELLLLYRKRDAPRYPIETETEKWKKKIIVIIMIIITTETKKLVRCTPSYNGHGFFVS